MGSYNSINFTKLIVNGIPYNKAYMGSKILFNGNWKPFTIEALKDNVTVTFSVSRKNNDLPVPSSYYAIIKNYNPNDSTATKRLTDSTRKDNDRSISVTLSRGQKIHPECVYNISTPWNPYYEYEGATGYRLYVKVGISYPLSGQTDVVKIYGDITTWNADWFDHMFEGDCITDVTELSMPTSIQHPNEFNSMFYYTKITDLTLKITDFSQDYCCYHLLPTNSGNSILHLPAGHNYPSTNTSWLPTNWTIQTIQEEPEFDYSAEYLTFKNVSEDNDIWVYWKHEWDSVEEDENGLDPDDYNLLIQYSFDKETWVNLSAGPDTENNTYNRFELQHGQTVYIKGNKYRYMISGEEDDYYGYFEFTKQYQSDELLVEVSGNIMSMVAGDNFQEAEFVNNGRLASLFKRNTDIVSAENLIIPANNTQSCFTFLFSGCSNMVKGPKITATDTPAQYAYNGMFYGCSSLTSISIDSPYTSGCYNNWLYNASASGTIYYTDDSWQNAPTGTSGIPSGWTATKVS